MSDTEKLARLIELFALLCGRVGEDKLLDLVSNELMSEEAPA